MDSRYSIENSFSTTAPGIGTGVGVNTLIARFDGERNSEAAEGTARTGSFLGFYQPDCLYRSHHPRTLSLSPLFFRFGVDSPGCRRLRLHCLPRQSRSFHGKYLDQDSAGAGQYDRSASGAARLSALALRSDRFLADVSPLGYVNRCFRSFSSEKSLQRFYEGRCSRRPLSVKSKKAGQCPAFGEYGTRTHGLLIANQLLYQLS